MHFSTVLVPLLLLAQYGVALPALEVRQATIIDPLTCQILGVRIEDPATVLAAVQKGTVQPLDGLTSAQYIDLLEDCLRNKDSNVKAEPFPTGHSAPAAVANTPAPAAATDGNADSGAPAAAGGSADTAGAAPAPAADSATSAASAPAADDANPASTDSNAAAPPADARVASANPSASNPPADDSSASSSSASTDSAASDASAGTSNGASTGDSSASASPANANAAASTDGSAGDSNAGANAAASDSASSGSGSGSDASGTDNNGSADVNSSSSSAAAAPASDNTAGNAEPPFNPADDPAPGSPAVNGSPYPTTFGSYSTGSGDDEGSAQGDSSGASDSRVQSDRRPTSKAAATCTGLLCVAEETLSLAAAPELGLDGIQQGSPASCPNGDLGACLDTRK